MRRVESFEENIWFTPFTADHHIVPGLVPEVVPKCSGITWSFPISNNSEIVPVQENKTACGKTVHLLTNFYMNIVAPAV